MDDGLTVAWRVVAIIVLKDNNKHSSFMRIVWLNRIASIFSILIENANICKQILCHIALRAG